MFELAWSEMLVIAVVMIVIVGPKDLPKMLRTFGKFTSKMTSMAGDFRKQFDEAMKEADLDDVRQSVSDLRSLNPKNEIRKAFSPMEQAAADIRAGADSIMRPKTPVPSTPASTEPSASEPLKNGSGMDAAEQGESPSLQKPSFDALAPAAPAVAAAPAAPVAAAAALPEPTPAAAPVKKPRAPKSTAPADVSTTPTKATRSKLVAPEAVDGLNGAAVAKPVRARKPKETGTPT